MPWFYYLEQHVTKSFHVIYAPFDDKIPFIEYFIVPYYLWFPFVVVPVLYFFFKDKDEFYKTVKFMIIGMTIFLIFSTIYPAEIPPSPAGRMLHPSGFCTVIILIPVSVTAIQTAPPAVPIMPL